MLPNQLFEVFGKGVYMYGICIGVGILACLLAFYWLTKKKNVPSSVQDFVFFVAIAAIAVGFLFAKLYQALYDYIENPAAGFDFYGAGITVMGGLIGGAITFIAVYFGIGALVFRGEKKGLHIREFNSIIRVAPICIVIAHAFGRIGCLMSGCCHGALLSTTEYVVGGIWMKGTTTGQWGYYVPTQLYEALFLFALGGLLIYLLLKKNCNIIMPIYLGAYGIWRIFIEFFRDDHVGELIAGSGFKPSQWQSIVFIAIAIIMLLVYFFLKMPYFYKVEPSVVRMEKEAQEKAAKFENLEVVENSAKPEIVEDANKNETTENAETKVEEKEE